MSVKLARVTPEEDRLLAAVLAVHRSHRLYRIMVEAQRTALRRSRAGLFRLASQRWGLLLDAHVARQTLLRSWGIIS